MEITLNVSEDAEGTAAPWWLIVDPKQMMKPDAAAVVMGMITGPFFSREEAEDVLKARRHHYSDRAVVWCHSGCCTREYKKAYEEASCKRSRECNNS